MALMKASLFVTTYEMPRHLALVLAGIQRQTLKDFELFLCDDGSGAETKRVIQEFQEKVSLFRTQHIWQVHQGFRKCRILNQALLKAQGEVAIFLDGDCIPHPAFVQDHVEGQTQGFYLAGRRVELGELFSDQLTPALIAEGFLDYPRSSFIFSALRQETQHFNRSIRIPFPKVRALLGMNRIADLKGCNYSLPRAVLEEINGFDESYEGYGREDTDVEVRLQNLGLQIKSMKGVALQFHVWHPRREFTEANEELLQAVKRTGRVYALKGLRSHS